MRALLLFILIISHINIALSKKCTVITPKAEVHIISNLSPNSPSLEVHCQSGEDDLGKHVVGVNQDYHWDFCNNVLGTTLFSCNLRSGSKEVGFVAYSAEWRQWCPKNVCKWTAKEDGIYFYEGKKYQWNIKCC